MVGREFYNETSPDTAAFWIFCEDIWKLYNFSLFTTVQDLKFGDISSFYFCLLVLYLSTFSLLYKGSVSKPAIITTS